MNLIYHYGLWHLQALECMGQHAGSMSCLVGGNLLLCTPSGLIFSHLFILTSFQTALSQHCTKVAYHRSWLTNNPLVPVTLRSLAANLCHGRTRNNWATPHDCPQCSKLYNLSHIIRSALSTCVYGVDLFPWFSYLTGILTILLFLFS